MSTTIVSLGKNLVLMVLLAITLLSFFNRILNWNDLLLVQALTGLFYIFLSYYEYNSTAYKAQLPIERYAYYPGSFFLIRAFKIGIYLLFGGVLATSSSAIKFLYPICFIIALTEIIITVLKYYQRLCFVNLYANYILIAKEKMEKIFASEIENIEYRHDIIYIVKKNKKTTTVKGFSVKERMEFLKKTKDWIVNNKIAISSESFQKLNDSLK